MQNNLTAVVLAAGEGKRMEPLGANISKVMLPILGKPVIAHVLDKILEARVERIVIVITPKGDFLREHLKSAYRGAKIEYVYQKKQLGPAQAISLALPKVKSKYCLVQYGDSLTDINVAQKVIETLGENPDIDGVLAVRAVDDPSRYGIIKYQNGNIVEVIEKPTHPPSNHAVMGTYILKTSSFNKAIEDEKFQYGKELFPAQYILAKGGKMASFEFSGKRVDVGKPENLFDACQLLAAKTVKCIAFDADNTLYNSHQAAPFADSAAMKLLSKKVNINFQNLYKEWQKIVEKIKDSKEPEIRTRLYSYGQLCTKYNLSSKFSQEMFSKFRDTLLANLKATNGIKEILENLPQDKYVVTDDITQLADKKLTRLDLSGFFKEVITSDKVGTTKPSKNFYVSLLKKYQPEEILVVGDNWQKDLEIPAQLGMQVLFIENSESFKKLQSLATRLQKIHIMGIAGAGAAAVAGIAKGFGYNVTGCDISPNSPYTENLDINIEKGHHANHIKDIDMLVVSPAIEKTDPNNPGLQRAKGLNLPILTWQEFQGKYLQRDKFVICVAGAYGKSTTTAMISQILIDASLDPTCEIGAKVIEWNSNFSVGKSKYYVCEADEYNNNFLNYEPDIAIILNTAWDHPDFFKSQQSVLNSYRKFVSRIKSGGILIITDSAFQILLFERSREVTVRKDIEIVKIGDFGKLKLSIIGDFRKLNANAALTVAQVMGLNLARAKKSVENFKGIGRRLEFKGEISGVKFYDDYAVQPYTIKTAVNALEKRFKNKKLALVFEPHTFSRIQFFFNDFVKSLRNTNADQILVTDVYAAREHGDKTKLAQKLAKAIGPKAQYVGSLKQAMEYLKTTLTEFEVVLSMGAGDIYKLYGLIKSNKNPQVRA